MTSPPPSAARPPRRLQRPSSRAGSGRRPGEAGNASKIELRLVKPAIEKRAVAPRRQSNRALRTREHLTEAEVEKLIETAKDNRYGHRDATMILVTYRHGLRASEVCDLRWEQIDFNSATLHVRRVKNGKPSTHPVLGDELRALRKLQREMPKSPFMFVRQRCQLSPLSRQAIRRCRYKLCREGA